MTALKPQLTVGHVSRHVPPSSSQQVGRDIALLDIAQDLLLAHLHAAGVSEVVVFKGGTALRKHHAGSRGRFSTDLDFALRSPDDDRATVARLVAEAADGHACGPAELRDREVQTAVFESRQELNDRKDRREIMGAQRDGVAPADLVYRHGRPKEEPLLWLADAIVGAVGLSVTSHDHELAEMLPAPMRQIRWITP